MLRQFGHCTSTMEWVFWHSWFPYTIICHCTAAWSFLEVAFCPLIQIEVGFSKPEVFTLLGCYAALAAHCNLASSAGTHTISSMCEWFTGKRTSWTPLTTAETEKSSIKATDCTLRIIHNTAQPWCSMNKCALCPRTPEWGKQLEVAFQEA